MPGPFDPIQDLLVQYRQDVVNARIELASEHLSAERRNWLWQLVDCREWLIKLAANDFHAELERIDRELEERLRRR